MPTQPGKRSRSATPLEATSSHKELQQQEQHQQQQEEKEYEEEQRVQSSQSDRGTAVKTNVKTKLSARKAVKKEGEHQKRSNSSSNNKSSRLTARSKSNSNNAKSKERSNVVNSKMKRTHLVVGTLTRSKEALDSLAQHKTEEEIWHDVVPFKRITDDSDFSPTSMHKLITWNVAGLRGLLKKDNKTLEKFLNAEQPDILCLQETKLNVSDAEANAKLGVVDGYSFVDHPCSTTKGYSGTRTYVKDKSFGGPYRAMSVCGFTFPSKANKDKNENNAKIVTKSISSGSGGSNSSNVAELKALAKDVEGRVLTTFLTSPLLSTQKVNNEKKRDSNNAEKSKSEALQQEEEIEEEEESSQKREPFEPMLAIVNSYVANSGMNLDRLPYRTQMFDTAMRNYLHQINTICKTNSATHKMIWDGGFIWTGDLNVAEKDFDRYYSVNYKNMQECSGFTPEERSSFRTTLMETNSVDVFRELYPRSGPVYTFWSQRINARARNAGWRLDYFVASSSLLPFVVDCFPMLEVGGSDHCPLQLWLKKALWRGKVRRLLKSIRK